MFALIPFPVRSKVYVDILRPKSRSLGEIRGALLTGLLSQEQNLIMNKYHASSLSHVPASQPKLQTSQIKPYDLALALTLMEGDRYRVLGPPDYLAFLMKHPGHNLIEDVYSTNDKIIVWVKCSILHYEKVEKRVEVLKFFINAAEVSETFPLVIFLSR